MEDGGDCAQHAAHRSVRVVARQRTLTLHLVSYVLILLTWLFSLIARCPALYTLPSRSYFSLGPRGTNTSNVLNNLDNQPDNEA